MRRSTWPPAALTVGLFALFMQAPGVAQAQANLSADEAQKIGVEAVVYGVPLVVMDLTKRVSTNVPGPQPNAHPAAAGDFSATMRVYWPKPAMLDGSWAPPPVKRVN